MDLNGLEAHKVYTITGMSITIDGIMQHEHYALDNHLGLSDESLAYQEVKIVS
jgi:hypothetical protein